MRTARDILIGVLILPWILLRVLAAFPFVAAGFAAFVRGDDEAADKYERIVERIAFGRRTDA